MTPERPIVSDHAVLRCLQRVFGVAVELVRALIDDATAQGRRAVAADLGDDLRFAIVLAQAKFVIDSGYVVTTLAREHGFRPKARRRR